jgi:hypothetical protein
MQVNLAKGPFTKIPVVPDRPYFFLPTLLFFQHDWLCDPIFSTWLRAALYAQWALYIYIWSKNFSHSVNEKSEAKWNQDGGHWRPIALKVVNSFYTISPPANSSYF